MRRVKRAAEQKAERLVNAGLAEWTKGGAYRGIRITDAGRAALAGRKGGAKYTALDACRWVQAGTAPKIASSSRTTPMWRALGKAAEAGLIERDGFDWKLTDAGRAALAEAQ